MRYYLYLDKCFLRNLFCVKDSSDFNIEVVECLIRKNDANSSQIALDPCIENFCEREDEGQPKKDVPKRYKDTNFTKKRVNSNYGVANSSSVETQRRYINIEDITEIKKNCFYHQLIEKLRKEEVKNDQRIIQDEGKIIKCNDKYYQTSGSDIDFFILNDKLVMIKSQLLDANIDLLSKLSCKIKVIGYVISSLNSGSKVIKAIAIYIE